MEMRLVANHTKKSALIWKFLGSILHCPLCLYTVIKMNSTSRKVIDDLLFFQAL